MFSVSIFCYLKYNNICVVFFKALIANRLSREVDILNTWGISSKETQLINLDLSIDGSHKD